MTSSSSSSPSPSVSCTIPISIPMSAIGGVPGVFVPVLVVIHDDLSVVSVPTGHKTPTSVMLLLQRLDLLCKHVVAIITHQLQEALSSQVLEEYQTEAEYLAKIVQFSNCSADHDPCFVKTTKAAIQNCFFPYVTSTTGCVIDSTHPRTGGYMVDMRYVFATTTTDDTSSSSKEEWTVADLDNAMRMLNKTTRSLLPFDIEEWSGIHQLRPMIELAIFELLLVKTMQDMTVYGPLLLHWFRLFWENKLVDSPSLIITCVQLLVCVTDFPALMALMDSDLLFKVLDCLDHQEYEKYDTAGVLGRFQLCLALKHSIIANRLGNVHILLSRFALDAPLASIKETDVNHSGSGLLNGEVISALPNLVGSLFPSRQHAAVMEELTDALHHEMGSISTTDRATSGQRVLSQLPVIQRLITDMARQKLIERELLFSPFQNDKLSSVYGFRTLSNISTTVTSHLLDAMLMVNLTIALMHYAWHQPLQTNLFGRPINDLTDEEFEGRDYPMWMTLFHSSDLLLTTHASRKLTVVTPYGFNIKATRNNNNTEAVLKVYQQAFEQAFDFHYVMHLSTDRFQKHMMGMVEEHHERKMTEFGDICSKTLNALQERIVSTSARLSQFLEAKRNMAAEVLMMEEDAKQMQARHSNTCQTYEKRIRELEVKLQQMSSSHSMEREASAERIRALEESRVALLQKQHSNRKSSSRTLEMQMLLAAQDSFCAQMLLNETCPTFGLMVELDRTIASQLSKQGQLCCLTPAIRSVQLVDCKLATHRTPAGSGETDSVWLFVNNQELSEALGNNQLEEEVVPPICPLFQAPIEKPLLLVLLEEEESYVHSKRTCLMDEQSLPILVRHAVEQDQPFLSDPRCLPEKQTGSSMYLVVEHSGLTEYWTYKYYQKHNNAFSATAAAVVVVPEKKKKHRGHSRKVDKQCQKVINKK